MSTCTTLYHPIYIPIGIAPPIHEGFHRPAYLLILDGPTHALVLIWDGCAELAVRKDAPLGGNSHLQHCCHVV